MRREYRWGPARIGHQLGLASSTVHRIITAAGLGRLDQGDRITAGPPQRVGWRYVHTAIDDRTRLGYSEIHTNETARTAVGFLQRALRRFQPGRRPRRAGPDRQRPLLSVEALEAEPASSSGFAPSIPAGSGRRPTARSNASTGPSLRNGPTSGPGCQKRSAVKPSIIHSPLQSSSTPRSAQLGHTYPTLQTFTKDNLPRLHT